jgi:hypothetical protein
MIDRLARVLFVAELALLAAPALIALFSSFTALADLSDVVTVPQAEGARGLGLPGMAAFALYGLTLSAFCVLAVRYLIGGGSGVARVTPIVWALALLGQAIVLPSVAWASVFEFAPNWVRIVALLTFPALGLFIPVVHLLAAALIARRNQSRPSLA